LKTAAFCFPHFVYRKGNIVKGTDVSIFFFEKRFHRFTEPRVSPGDFESFAYVFQYNHRILHLCLIMHNLIGINPFSAKQTGVGKRCQWKVSHVPDEQNGIYSQIIENF